MASFPFNPVQLHLSSLSHSSALNTFHFHPSFCFLCLSKPAKQKPKPQFQLLVTARLSRDTTEEVTVPNAEFLPSFTDDGEAIGRRDVLKDRNEKIRHNSRRRKAVISEDSSVKLKGENHEVNVVERDKRAKKSKIDPPETILRIGLDLCSKRGDVVGAIELYDLAKREGVKMGQYHYAVLLYLCASAAAGIIQPAKSGSGERSLSSGARDEVNSVVESDSLRKFSEISQKNLEGLVKEMRSGDYLSSEHDEGKGYGIQISNDVKGVALEKGFEMYNEMCREKVAMNEATLTSIARMAMALGDGDMAFDIVKKMKEHSISPRLRSYGPALAIFCGNGDVEKAFLVEKHMLENGVHPEEPELQALLRVSVEAGKSDEVYYVLHKLRTSVRQVSEATADLVEKWFRSKVASRVGKRKWDKRMIAQAMENGGGGWHGKGWLGQGKWNVRRSPVGLDGLCKSCGAKLATIDLDPAETENFAKSVAALASQREKNSSFQKFQKWLEYYGPFEAVVDAANVGLYSQRRFKPSKVNAVVNGIRQMLPSRKWPLIVLHNRRITGEKMDEPFNKSLIEKWRNADALYATPTGSNDDWYWLYAAIKFRCLLVTNDEMRDHLFQLLGNDFFPKWKERHQVHFSFAETGPVFHMPPPCSIVIQESEKGNWHIPIASELENDDDRMWLCCTRAEAGLREPDRSDIERGRAQQKKRETRLHARRKSRVEVNFDGQGEAELQELRLDLSASIIPELESAEKHGGCVIDFQI